MTLGNRVKTVFVSCAVVVALLASIIPRPVHPPAPSRSVVDIPVVYAITIMVTPVTVGEDEVPLYTNAVLVDAKRRLFLSVVHGVELSELTYVMSRTSNQPMLARAPRRWRNDPADLAVIQVLGAGDISGIAPVRLALRPPLVGDVMTLHGYLVRPDEEHKVVHFVRVVRPFRVRETATDICLDANTCAVRNELITQLLEGKALTRLEYSDLYPHFIYAVALTGDGSGVEPGLSGSPIFDGNGVVTGITSSYLITSDLGRHGFFAPAYRALPLLARAQADVDAGRVP
jgi:hypothetical protein